MQNKWYPKIVEFLFDGVKFGACVRACVSPFCTSAGFNLRTHTFTYIKSRYVALLYRNGRSSTTAQQYCRQKMRIVYSLNVYRCSGNSSSSSITKSTQLPILGSFCVRWFLFCLFRSVFFLVCIGKCILQLKQKARQKVQRSHIISNAALYIKRNTLCTSYQIQKQTYNAT